MELALVVRGGTLDGRVFSLAEGQILTVGRGAHCDIRLEDQGVSRQHCSFERRGDQIVVRDLRSANGTFVNDRRVDLAPLDPGDQVRLGYTWLECRGPRVPTQPARTPGAMLSVTGEGPTGETVIRKRIDPKRLDWLATPAPRAEELALLRRAQRHLSTVHEVSDLLSGARDIDALFESIVATILEVTGADRAALLVRSAEGDGDGVELAAARTRKGGAGDAEFAVSRTVVRDVLENGLSTLSRDAASDVRYREGESVILQGIRSVMCAPLRTTEAILGVLYVDSRRAAGKFTEADLELLTAIGNQAGIALHRARLLADLEQLFLDTIRAIAATIDAKDGYTHRHSERVAAFGVRIAEALGMTEEKRKVVELSALLHDVGKIGVPESILNKPGKLTREEFEEMKRHPVHGARILSKIQSPQVAALLPGVKYHHEKWDGTGYPEGLRGTGIPLLGRLLCVADVLDALTSTRSYRDALTIDEAVHLVRKGKATHFDPEIADAACSLHARGELFPEGSEPPLATQTSGPRD